jgi:hypothetical protein
MSAYKDLLKKGAIQHTKLDLAVIYYGEHPVDETEVRDAEQAAAELQTLRNKADEADKLRRNFARYLSHDYLKNPANVADICDNSLDKTGALLGYVREAAYNLKEHGVEIIE